MHSPCQSIETLCYSLQRNLTSAITAIHSLSADRHSSDAVDVGTICREISISGGKSVVSASGQWPVASGQLIVDSSPSSVRSAMYIERVSKAKESPAGARFDSPGHRPGLVDVVQIGKP